MKIRILLSILCLFSFCKIQAQNTPVCNNSVILDGNETATADYESSNWIQSDQTIDPTAIVDYSAVDSICLNEDFEVILGAVFHAYIDPTACVGSSNPPCGTDGAMFSDTNGPFAFDVELCFDGTDVNVNITYPTTPYPSGMIIFIPPPGGGTPPGYNMTEINPGHFSRTCLLYTSPSPRDS